MSHPGDPDTHSHHNSIFVSYGKVNGFQPQTDRGVDPFTTGALGYVNVL